MPGLLRAIVPRSSEPVAPEFYRFIGKLRVIFVSALLGLNVLTTLSLDSLGLDRDTWFRLQIPNTILLVTSISLGGLIASGRLGIAAMRRATHVCIVAEMGSALLSMWSVGTVSSHMALGAVLIAALYRTVFDFRTGTLAFAVLFFGFWVVVIGEITGLWPSQPLSVEGLDIAYRTAERELTGAAFLSLMIVLAFISVNWMVARLRHREHAIQVLRESLVADDGEFGRHTGRTLLDTYVIGALIGTGGMGEVYRARHRRTRRPVAVKLLHPHLAADPVLLARFRREAEIGGTVGSEHIADVIDVDVDEGQPFLVLELLDGETLRDRVERDGPLSLEVAAAVFSQLGAGLDAAHRAGVVHRDLKPENLMLLTGTGMPRLKILDFGVSKIGGNASTALTADLTLLGTPGFMSPEQAVGATAEADTRTDVFAAGGVIYYALTGRRPFQGSSVPALLRKICDEAPVPFERLRPDLGERGAAIAAVLAIAMAKPPAQRYDAIVDLVGDLQRAIDGALPESVRTRAAAVDGGRPTAHVVGDAAIDANQETEATRTS